KVIAEYLPVLHYKFHTLEFGDIIRRIAGDGNEVCILASLDRPHSVAPPILSAPTDVADRLDKRPDKSLQIGVGSARPRPAINAFCADLASGGQTSPAGAEAGRGRSVRSTWRVSSRPRPSRRSMREAQSTLCRLR